jgi:hypothetical protein
LSFNTIYGEFQCPHCHDKIASGVGFRFGTVNNLGYRVGDELDWTGPNTRPKARPPAKVVKTVGYFNCDNIRCSSWRDCYPAVQRALITIENNRIVSVAPFYGEASDDGFDIIEPKGLS